MDQAIAITETRVQPEPLPDNIRSIQPGGGFCYSVELAWGRVRRWYLKKFRSRYLRQILAMRVGDPDRLPHEVLDPRDLKFIRNQTDCHWRAEDDPFRWRERIPLARWGLAEVQLMGWPLLVVTIVLALTWWYAAPITGALFLLVVSFFRDPPRRIPQEPGLLVSPADGKVVEIAQLEHDEFVGVINERRKCCSWRRRRVFGGDPNLSSNGSTMILPSSISPTAISWCSTSCSSYRGAKSERSLTRPRSRTGTGAGST